MILIRIKTTIMIIIIVIIVILLLLLPIIMIIIIIIIIVVIIPRDAQGARELAGEPALAAEEALRGHL